MMGLNGWFLCIFAFLLHSTPVRAYESEDLPGYIDPTITKFQDTISFDLPNPSEERERKFSAALEALGIPPEPAPGFHDFPAAGLVNQTEMAAHFRTFDPDGGLRRYLQLEQGKLSFYRAFFEAFLPQHFLEFTYPFSARAGSLDSDSLLFRLRFIAHRLRKRITETPLAGLRIVIDPGHMGTEHWDVETGKFVKIGGQKVSEGEIALWTSLLLANELESLGATVTLTRTRGGTVASTTPAGFNVEPYVNQYFYNAKDSWMSPLLNLPESSAIRAVKSAPETAKARSSLQRGQFFIFGEDLEARSRIIDSVDPDLVLVIHYDASQSDKLQSTQTSIEAFVPGGVRANETGSRVFRSHHLKHLLEVRRWRESVELAAAMTGELSKSAGLPLLDSPEFMSSIRVKDGVYARNLYLNRRNLRALTVYMECLHYDHVDEFPRLARATESGSYKGMPFRYPARLRDVVSGLKNGVLKYFAELPLNERRK